MNRTGTENDEKLMEEIRNALVDVHNDMPNFRTLIANKHVVIYLGNTRSGKSTLVNYLMGTKLMAFEERSPIFKIKKVDENSRGPAIGQGTQSCTSIPGVYSINESMVIIDAPGFDDNRSEAQDIMNALYINQIKYARTVKFVFVSDLNDLLCDNVKAFTDLMEKVHSVMPNFDSLMRSTSIVFTKDLRQYSQGEVASLLKQKILDVDGLPIQKEFVQYFVDNTDFIAFFRMPTRAGEITKTIDDNIDNARMTSCAIILDEKNIKVTLSAKSRLALMKIYQHYLDSAYFELQIKKIIQKFPEYFYIDDYVFASLNDELKDVKDNLTRISTLFETEINLSKSITNLCEIKHSLLRIFHRNISLEFTRSFNTLVMIDDALLMEDAIKLKFKTEYDRTLTDTLKEIKKLIVKIDDEIKGRQSDRTLFNASAGVTGVAGVVTVAGEVLHRVFANGARAGSPFGLLGIVGGIVSAVGAGVTSTSYVVQKETQKKRIQARRKQGRDVLENMFDED